uniref:Uncharacterized protein n=1 Tax=Aspergillus fumigatus TaxID=746128 RepID=Q6MY60_ASPFM|nr:hypothetical protein AfA10A1.005 [Aspergillus fumigatus]
MGAVGTISSRIIQAHFDAFRSTVMGAGFFATSGSGVPPACSAGHSVWLGKSEKTGNYGTAQNYQVRLGIKNFSSHGIMNHSYTVLQ